VDDSLHATRAAVEEGIVPGGGVALARASLILDELNVGNDDQRVGVDIVKRAVRAPLRQIAENSGEDGGVISSKVLENDNYNWGFDAQTGRFKDMVEAGIIDPTKVVRSALQHAASIGSLMITTEAMVAERSPEADGASNNRPGDHRD
jgi:chaperonin GroEL